MTPPYLTCPLTLREMLEIAEKSRCWHGIFAGKARCPRQATWRKRDPRGPKHEGHHNALLIGARYCDAHRHHGDLPFAKGDR